MSGRRSSVSDYPEHLNPFYEGGDKWHFWGKIKRSGSFSNSLKDLRNTITLRSFRGHKKPKYEKDSDVQLRNHTYDGYSTVSRQTLPAYRQAHIVTSTPLLPRSRFSERVRKSVDNYDSSKNPFENGDDEEVDELKPEDYRKRVRRRKRRAPLPPGVKDSSWSLTSVETDVSSYPHSEVSDLDVSEIEKPMAEICEMLQSFTKEIEKMTDSFNSNQKSLESDEIQNRTEAEDTSVCPKIVITSAECSPAKENILIIESVSYTTEDEDQRIQQRPLEESSKSNNESCERKVEDISPDHSSKIVEEIVNGTETSCEIIKEETPSLQYNREVIEEQSLPSSCDQEIIEEKSPTLDHDREIIEEKLHSSGCDNEIIEEKSAPLGCDRNIIEEKSAPSNCNREVIEETSPPSGCDRKIIEEESSSLQYDRETSEDKTSSGSDHEKIKETSSLSQNGNEIVHEELVKEEPPQCPSSSDHEIIKEKVQNLDNINHLNNNSEGLGVSHFGRHAHDMKYIDESYTIHDRVLDDSDTRNDTNEKINETNNNKEYIPNGSYAESKFPVGENDFANGNGTSTNKNGIEQKEIQEQPPIPKVRKKKFTKAKLLGFFSGK